MQTTTRTIIEVTPDERATLIELLDRERRNLPVEIRHTRTASFRHSLEQRLDVVESLLRCLTLAEPTH